MKDIDFDELDKAVNSLMGSVPADADTNDRPKTQSLTVPTTLPGDGQPLSYSAIDQAAARIGGETIVKRQEATEIVSEALPGETNFTVDSTPAEPLVSPVQNESDGQEESTRPVMSSSSQRRGQFMDVFHPSSDMKQRSNSMTRPVDPIGSRGDQIVKQDEVLPGAQKVSHEAPVLAPINDVDTIHAPEEEPVIEAVKPLEESSAIAIEEDIPATDSEAAIPLATPFLPDAKVKKRPLGGVPQAPAFPDEATAPVRIEPQLAAPTPEEHVPDELKNDVMAIELAGTPEADLLPDDDAHIEVLVSQGAEEPVIPEVVEQQVDKISEESSEVSAPSLEAPQEESAAPVEQTTVENSVPDTATSTPKTELSEAAGGAIYDTTEYHAPVAHPAKQSNWLWVVLIIVIIVVGAGGGAILYLMTSAQ